ncbi:MAG: hypothetical protein ACK4GL_06900 [Flavobacteriales bacterium]
MKKLIILICLSLFAVISFAQDIIYLKDGTNIVSMVVAVDKRTVKYKKPSGKGPINEIAKSRVIKIQYESGAIDDFTISTRDTVFFSRTGIDDAFFPNSYLTDLKDNIISLNLFDFFDLGVGMAYERVFDGGTKSLRIPAFFSLRDTLGPFSDRFGFKTFETGLDLLFYPTGQGRLKYSVGPSIRYGGFRIYEDQFVLDPVTGFGYFISSNRNTSTFAFGVNNFITLMASNNLYFSGNMAIGVRKINDYPDKSRATRTHFNIGMHLGYRF